ncbi:MAG: hypothetical protein ACLGG7_11795, partial [Bacteriovoracia bacterium]
DPVGAKERPRDGAEVARGLEGILAQGVLPPGSTKRCVYRGAGAVCRTDSGNIAATEIEKRKLLTCAPNFWCADVDSTNANIPNTSTTLNVFNKEVARFARPLDEVPVTNNHLYGRDANFLGRPLDYVHNKNSTPVNSLTQIGDSSIRSTIDANVAAMDAGALGRAGLCRPGKRLPTPSDISSTWNPFVQHQGLDEFSRTDYINQIASCPANYLSVNKLASCSVIGDDGNYLHQSTAFASITGSISWGRRAIEQNSCGLDNLRNGSLTTNVTADQLQNNSPMKLIEGRPLNALINVAPTLVRDACLRRAGSVCNTDLDCSPNKFHADQTQFFDQSFFGNTPNREFNEQFLVCGQGTPKPGFNSPDADSYDMTKNVCCREVGSDITTYSAQQPNGTNSVDPVTANLNPAASGISEPTNPGRYERFSNVRSLGTSFPLLSAHSARNATTGVINPQTYSGALTGGGTIPGNVMVGGQWRTLNETNSKTCCGGGWIRKFDDGTNNWTRKDRFRVDVPNFRCLNYLSPLVTTATPNLWGLNQSQIDADYSKYCFDITGATGNCAQITLQEGSVSDVSCSTAESDSSFNVDVRSQVATLPGQIAYSASANLFSFFPLITGDEDINTVVDYTLPSGRRNVTVFVPSYMGNSSLDVSAHRTNPGNPEDAGNTRTCALVATGATGINAAGDVGTCPDEGGRCCYEYNTLTRLLKVAIIPGDPGDFRQPAAGDNASLYGIKIGFIAPGRTANTTLPRAKRACSDVHYLDVLGRMELAGIPQITYEKLVCNNNQTKIVPGLFNVTDSDNNIASCNTPSFAFFDSSKWRTNHFGLQNAPVFSSKDFKCCTPAGKTTASANLCCSGYAVEPEDGSLPPGTLKCVLPSGTDLSIYFNRFVSNEGQGDHLTSASLSPNDFNTQTGEPLLTPAVNAKVTALGAELCESQATRRGGAFGNYNPEPFSPASQGETIYGIVDSAADIGLNSSGGGTDQTGYNVFMQGFRWNHHIYCQ